MSRTNKISANRSLMYVCFAWLLLLALMPHKLNAQSQRVIEEFAPEQISVVHNEVDRSFSYRIYRPNDLKEGEKVPLVVFLHGAGERGGNNTSQLRHFPDRFVTEPHLKKHKAILLAVQCPKGEAWTKFSRDFKVENQAKELAPSMAGVVKAIEKVVAEDHVDLNRIYLTGLSMGGYGSWDLASRYPEWFAAVVPICGGGSPKDMAPQLVDVPIWAFHGTADRVVPEIQTGEMIDAIREAGGKPKYTQLDGVGHNSWSFAYGPKGAMDWMFAQKRKAPAKILTSRSPNIVLVMSDDQGYGDLSCHGNPVLETPNLDRLASRSCQMGAFYVQPVCAPTRAALMTGRVPQRTTAIDTWIARAMLATEEITIAERLKEHGYATGIFGKWHLGDCHPMRPIDQGFDTAVIHLGGGIGQPSDLEGGERKYTDPVLSRNGEREQFQGYCTDIFFDEALAWMSEQQDPFLCVITTNAPHGPYHDVPPALYEKYTSLDVSAAGADNDDRMAREFAMIENIDQNVGKLVAGLEAMGETNNTLVIFLHDNGPQWERYNGGLRGIKGSVYDGGIRTPLFACWPGEIPPGVRTEAVGQHVDLVPTILEAAGAPAANDIDGTSLMGVFRNQDDGNFDRSIVVQSHRGDVPVAWHNAMIRRGDWKLVNASGFGKELEVAPLNLELFNVRDDPGETTNRAQEHPELVKELTEEYEAWYQDVGANDPANYIPPAISIGAIQEPVILTRQDWRRKAKGGWWNGRGDGRWRVEVMDPGPYRVRVRFLPKQPSPEHVRILMDGNELASQGVQGGGDVVFGSVELPTGIGHIEVPLRDSKGTYGAYQVIVEPLPEA